MGRQPVIAQVGPQACGHELAHVVCVQPGVADLLCAGAVHRQNFHLQPGCCSCPAHLLGRAARSTHIDAVMQGKQWTCCMAAVVRLNLREGSTAHLQVVDELGLHAQEVPGRVSYASPAHVEVPAATSGTSHGCLRC